MYIYHHPGCIGTLRPPRSHFQGSRSRWDPANQPHHLTSQTTSNLPIGHSCKYDRLLPGRPTGPLLLLRPHPRTLLPLSLADPPCTASRLEPVEPRSLGARNQRRWLKAKLHLPAGPLHSPCLLAGAVSPLHRELSLRRRARPPAEYQVGLLTSTATTS